MQLHRRWMALAVPTAVGALVFSVPTASAPSRATAAARLMHGTAADAHPQGVLYSIHRGVVKDCVEIQLGSSSLQIWDNGAYKVVELMLKPESCWNLINKASVRYGGTVYTTYEYQDLRGDCLWDDGGLILTSNVCTPGANYESFFGVHYYRSGADGPGWMFTDACWGPSRAMATPDGEGVEMVPTGDLGGSTGTFYSYLWNFP
jgi:hypothetical protein